MLAMAQLLAVLGCTVFTGAAIYINLVEHPARMGCGTQVAALQWAPSYHRATLMQVPLAALGCLAGVAVWLMGGHMLWLVGAILLGCVIPFTLVAIMPINQQLLAPGRNLSSPETQMLLEQWGRLHAVRSLLSLAASLVYLALVVG